MAQQNYGILTDISKSILKELIENPHGLRAKSLQKMLNVPRRSIYNNLNRLRDLKILKNINPIWKITGDKKIINGLIFKDESNSCYFCGNKNIDKHHIVPIKEGGSSRDINILKLCPNHHTIVHRRGELIYTDSKFTIKTNKKEIIKSTIKNDKRPNPFIINYNTHTPLFPMEPQTEAKHLSPLKNAVKSDSPKEPLSNSMTTIGKPFKILWRPNNYRRQIKVKTKTNSGIENIKTAITTIDTTGTRLNYNQHTKLLSIHGFNKQKNHTGITIQYGKETITGIYSQNIICGNKEIFLIEANTSELCQKRIDDKKEDIKKYIDESIEKFIKQFNIKLPYEKTIWAKHGYEDWIKGEEFIDKIPREVIVHDTHFKKVYGEGIEFISDERGQEPTIKLKNYIKNRAIEDIAPEIVKEINKTNESIKFLKENNTEDIKAIIQTIRQQSEIILEHTKTNKETAIGLLTLTTFLKSQLPKEQKPDIKENTDRPGYMG